MLPRFLTKRAVANPTLVGATIRLGNCAPASRVAPPSSSPSVPLRWSKQSLEGFLAVGDAWPHHGELSRREAPAARAFARPVRAMSRALPQSCDLIPSVAAHQPARPVPLGPLPLRPSGSLPASVRRRRAHRVEHEAAIAVVSDIGVVSM